MYMAGLAQARAQREDMAESVRARELQVETDVAARYLGVQSAYQAIRVQEQSRQSAREQLRLAQDRYRLGSGSSLEVSDAQNNVTRAEGDYVNVMTPRHLPKPGSQCEQEMKKPPAQRAKCADDQMYYTTWFDTWRFINGKADEHWDPMALGAGPGPSAGAAKPAG